MHADQQPANPILGELQRGMLRVADGDAAWIMGQFAEMRVFRDGAADVIPHGDGDGFAFGRRFVGECVRQVSDGGLVSAGHRADFSREDAAEARRDVKRQGAEQAHPGARPDGLQPVVQLVDATHAGGV